MGPRKVSAFSGPFACGKRRWRALAPAHGVLAFALTLVAAAALTPGLAVGARSRFAAGGAGGEAPPATCVVHSLPGFTAQGEFAQTATVADVIEVECNPYVYGTGSKLKLTTDQLFSRCKGHLRWYVAGAQDVGHPIPQVTGERGVSVELDADGNATVALLAGPECAAGESLVSAHMEEEPFETFTTSFTVLPPENTPPGVFALPSAEVEDARTSSFATILQAEFPGGSEKLVRFASEELFSRCRVSPHLQWIRMDGSWQEGVSEVNGVQLDNNGNAFVIVLGSFSCAEGTSLIEVDLESKPFTTFTTTFTIFPPQPTENPAFTIEKRQQIMGSGFTTAPLTGSIGETVEYEIVVTNTTNVAETFSNFTDAHCDAGTIAGGPGSSALAPGQSTRYTCTHVLTEAGTYTNVGTVTGETVGGPPLTKTSNEVVVGVPQERSFTIEKRQAIVGSGTGFTREKLTGAIGQTVDYLVTITNTGPAPLFFSGFTDAHCDEGTISGGPGVTPVAPGSTTTYTCDHMLTSIGPYINEATVTGTAFGDPPLTETSNQVEIDVEKASKVEKPEVAKGGPLPFCAASPGPLRGASGPKRGTFTAQIGAAGIKQITFYLDGHRLKTFTAAQAKGGKFTVKIDARRLAYGTHRVSVTAVMRESACASVARSGVFVRPFTARITPKFTG